MDKKEACIDVRHGAQGSAVLIIEDSKAKEYTFDGPLHREVANELAASQAWDLTVTKGYAVEKRYIDSFLAGTVLLAKRIENA